MSYWVSRLYKFKALSSEPQNVVWVRSSSVQQPVILVPLMGCGRQEHDQELADPPHFVYTVLNAKWSCLKQVTAKTSSTHAHTLRDRGRERPVFLNLRMILPVNKKCIKFGFGKVEFETDKRDREHKCQAIIEPENSSPTKSWIWEPRGPETQMDQLP